MTSRAVENGSDTRIISTATNVLFERDVEYGSSTDDGTITRASLHESKRRTQRRHAAVFSRCYVLRNYTEPYDE